MEKKNWNLSLDVLRIIAALMVLMVHIGQRTTVNEYTTIGSKGVYFFFILSGYLAMNSYNKIRSSRDYYKNRFSRIIPEYYFILAINYVASAIRYHSQGISYSQIFEPFHGICGLRYIRYLFFLQYVLPSENFELWNNRYALWTMSSFAFFYLAVPLLYKLINSFKKALFTSIILLLCRNFMIQLTLNIFTKFGSFSGVDMVAGGVPINTLCFFMLGILIWHASTLGKRHAIGMVALLVAVLSSMSVYGYEMIFLVMLILAIEYPLNEVIPEKIKLSINRISAATFFIYLVHPLLIDPITNLAYIISGGGLQGWPIFSLIFILLFVSSYLSYLLYLKIIFCIRKLRSLFSEDA